jgi:predicted CoA-binding protein|tara:strand:- start:213 stop:395 length:183 start_codon:yes stop_codon:yes gene_type:complete
MDFTGFIEAYLVKNDKVSYKYWKNINEKQSWKIFQQLSKQDYSVIVINDITEQEYLQKNE